MKIPVLDYSQNTKYNPFSLLPNKLSIHNSCIFEKGSIYLSSMTPSPTLGHQQGCVVCTLNVRSLQVVLASEIFENIFCHIKDAPSSTLNVFFDLGKECYIEKWGESISVIQTSTLFEELSETVQVSICSKPLNAPIPVICLHSPFRLSLDCWIPFLPIVLFFSCF